MFLSFTCFVDIMLCCTIVTDLFFLKVFWIVLLISDALLFRSSFCWRRLETTTRLRGYFLVMHLTTSCIQLIISFLKGGCFQVICSIMNDESFGWVMCLIFYSLCLNKGWASNILSLGIGTKKIWVQMSAIAVANYNHFNIVCYGLFIGV